MRKKLDTHCSYMTTYLIYKGRERELEFPLAVAVSYHAVLNARQRRHRNFDINFSTGSYALSVGSEIGRFDFSRLVQ